MPCSRRSSIFSELEKWWWWWRLQTQINQDKTEGVIHNTKSLGCALICRRY